MHDSSNVASWDIWVDTGGTFTDVIARDPEGTMHRCKVLSSSALRGTIRRAINTQKFEVEQKWNAPRNFINGFTLHLFGHTTYVSRVRSFDPETSVITLDDPPERVIEPGMSFEVRSSEEAPILGAQLVTGTPPDTQLPPMTMRLGTTRGTNALLEHKGSPVALFVTKGFGDLLRIGTQQRPDLFAINIEKPSPQYETVVEVDERLDPHGNVLTPLDTGQLAGEVKRVLDSGITSAAVAFLHSYRNPEHEQKLSDYLKQKGFAHVSCSSELAPFIKIVPRTSTAVVNAYLAAVVETYFESIKKSMQRGRLYVMTSAGGLVQVSSYYAKDCLLSGPAGGVVGASATGIGSGYKKIISFDMGGTSTDVARFDGDFEYIFEHRVGDAHLVAPALAIETVAAGGGSICAYDGVSGNGGTGKLSVGPGSAGAHPGPACYGAGGPLTITDVNLLLGRLDPANFGIPLSVEAARDQFRKLLDEIEKNSGTRPGETAILEGLIDIANERMADAIRKISIRRGYDPQHYTLVAFGGAGGQHACAVAKHLGMQTVLFPADAGLLSAYGLGCAAIERFAERQYLKPLGEILPSMQTEWETLEREAKDRLLQEGVHESDIEIRRRLLNLRFAGQESTIQIECSDTTDINNSFKSQYKKLFGHWIDKKDIEVESARVIASTIQQNDRKKPASPEQYHPEPASMRKAFLNGSHRNIPVFYRSKLQPGAVIDGPALLLDAHSTSVIEKGWRMELDENLNGVAGLIRINATVHTNTHPEEVMLELFTARFYSIAEEMGEMLRRTALSVNVKERLDFSCGLLDADGELVVNAPHIPVHLGSLGICVRRIREALPMEPGDVVVTNHPAHGGSHLPDITVVTTVYTDDKKLIGYVASRAHHGELGGSVPGSMPPLARHLSEEGVVIPPMYLIKNGKARWDVMQKILSDAQYPTRSLNDNLADLNAAIAANERGVASLQSLVRESGLERVVYYMSELKKYAESRMRKTLQTIPDGIYKSEEFLDDGTPLRMRITITSDSAVIDFNGSGAMHQGNLNATPAIVNSVVIYVLRLLIDEDLPLNEGLMRAVTLHIPEGILNPRFSEDPSRCPAVVGGNVETSQRLVDTLLKPFKKVACSQGTMNNVVFGNIQFGYYETICGGCGAGPGFHGSSAVHHHMTNTRITDAELIEHRYPVRLETFRIRKNSGGKGKWNGGDGVVRIFQFLSPLTLSVLTQHRTVHPYGMEGGEDGATGKQYIIRKDGNIENLTSIDGCKVYPGDRFVIETPGGGGWGEPG